MYYCQLDNKEILHSNLLHCQCPMEQVGIAALQRELCSSQETNDQKLKYFGHSFDVDFNKEKVEWCGWTGLYLLDCYDH